MRGPPLRRPERRERGEPALSSQGSGVSFSAISGDTVASVGRTGVVCKPPEVLCQGIPERKERLLKRKGQTGRTGRASPAETRVGDLPTCDLQSRDRCRDPTGLRAVCGGNAVRGPLSLQTAEVPDLRVQVGKGQGLWVTANGTARVKRLSTCQCR